MRKIGEGEYEFWEMVTRRLNAVTKKLGLTKTEVAKRAGIQQRLYYRYIELYCMASFYQVYKIAKALNVSIDYLVGYKPKQKQCFYAFTGKGYACDKCGYESGTAKKDYAYCPGCGAKILYKPIRNVG